MRIWRSEWASDMANIRDDPNISATRTWAVEGAEGGLRVNNADMVLLHGCAVMTTHTAGDVDWRETASSHDPAGC